MIISGANRPGRTRELPATQIAEWAGRSVAVLLKVYAKCIEGGEQMARQRTTAALGLPDDDEA